MESELHREDSTSPKVYTKISQVTSTESRGAGGAAAELGRRLLLASREGDTHAVRLLMAQGAPFTTDWLGTNALHLAAGGGHTATCAALLRAGATHDARNKVERTPLLLAAGAGHAACVRLLLQAGANVNARDMLHMTALHWAARRGHAAAAALLVRAGADRHGRDKFLLTPRELAAAHHPEMLPLFEADDAEKAAAGIIPPELDMDTEDYETEQKIELEESAVTEAEKPIKTEPDNPELKRTCTQDNTTADASTSSNPDCSNSGNTSNFTSAGNPGAAALLARHGIALLPPDSGSTLLSAIGAGRCVLLTDAGRLMLRDTPLPPLPAPTKVATPSRPVIIRPLTTPLKPLVKKIVHPNPNIKYMQLPHNAKIISATKCVPVKNKSKLSRGGLKLIVNKATPPAPTVTYAQVVQSQAAPSEALPPEAAGSPPASPGSLRRQLQAALRGVAALAQQLQEARAQLAEQGNVNMQ